MIIFLSGQDTFRSVQYLRKLIAKFKADRDPSGYNVVVLDAGSTGSNGSGIEIMREILTVPFLAERKLVVVRNLLVSDQNEAILEFYERMRAKTLPESNVVIVWEGASEFKNKVAEPLIKLLKNEKYSEDFSPLTGIALARWVESEISSNNASIARPALARLIAHAGACMWELNGLISQLTAYCANREITIADVSKFTEERADDNVFNLVDAIVSWSPRKVYAMIREQYKKGEDSQFVFAMLTRQFRILLELRDLFEREDNLTSEVLAKRLGLHPFVVKKSLPLVKRYSLLELKKIYNRLLDMDIRSKTGQMNMETSLDFAVCEIAYGR